MLSNSPYNNHGIPSDYLFGANKKSHPFTPKIIATQGNNKPQKWVYVRHNKVIVPPFCITKFGMSYINPEELVINFSSFKPGYYKIIAVHNFQVEDCNPNLNEALAGVFFARRSTGVYQDPEEQPLECRTIKVIGYMDTQKGCIYDSQ